MRLPGKVVYHTGPTGSGASGTIAVPNGAILTHVIAFSSGGGTVTIYGGDSIPIIANAPPTVIRFDDDCLTSGGNIVFTGTNSALVVYRLPGAQ